jgi:hypothetical protein
MAKEKEEEEYGSRKERNEKSNVFAADLYQVPQQPVRGILQGEQSIEEKKALDAREFTANVIQAVTAMQAVYTSTSGELVKAVNALTEEMTDATLKEALRMLVLTRAMGRSAQIESSNDILLQKLRKDAKEHGIELPIESQNDALPSFCARLQTLITNRLQPRMEP